MSTRDSSYLSFDTFQGVDSSKKDEEKTREELMEELKVMRQSALANRASRIMLDEMYQFVALLDHKGNLIDVNEPALHGGGMVRANIQGIPFWECRWWAVSEESISNCYKAVQRCMAGEFIRYECEIFGKSAGTEKITIDFSLMPLFDENGDVKLILPEGRNITEKRLAEIEITRKNNELRQLYEKVKELDELKTQFFANVSHELRTPLTLITHPTEKLLKDPNINQESKKYLEVIARNTRGLLKHVNDLLDISKLEAGKMMVNYAMVDVGHAVNVIASCFELLAADKSVGLSIKVPDEGMLMAAIDKDKIERVVTNLISNAFKFTPAQGHITVSVETFDMNGVPSFKLTVADTGPGVPESQRQVIFDRFRQVDGSSTRKHGGTGLGLSIVKEFVQIHGGRVEVASPKVGTGAIFNILIPLSPNIEHLSHKSTVSDLNVKNQLIELDREKQPLNIDSTTSTTTTNSTINEQAKDEDEGDEAHLKSMGSRFTTEMTARQAVEELEERESFNQLLNGQSANRDNGVILVVEDNPDMNRFIAELLCQRYVVHTALDGREGLEKTRSIIPDLIVTDCMMPVMSGDEMVHQIRLCPEFDNIPIVLLTAKADDNLRVHLLTNGVSDYINKPFSAEELMARVNNLMVMKKAKQFIQEELHIANNDLGELVNQLALKKRDLQVLVNELERERVQLDRASRSKDEFLMNLSHELRTPLNGILGWIQILHYADSSPNDLRRGLEAISRCACTQNSLIDDLLDMSLVISGKFVLEQKYFEAEYLVQCAIDTVGVTGTPKNINIQFDPEEVKEGEVPLAIRGDLQRLQQSVWNLLSNSIKFSNEGSTIYVKVSKLATLPSGNIVLPPGVCGQSAQKLDLFKNHAKQSHWCVISVSDSGCGISPRFLPHVFDRFRQADNSTTRGYGGLGLGLSIANNIVELHHGYLFAYSAGAGQGSTFSIVLPINTDQPPENPVSHGNRINNNIIIQSYQSSSSNNNNNNNGNGGGDGKNLKRAREETNNSIIYNNNGKGNNNGNGNGSLNKNYKKLLGDDNSSSMSSPTSSIISTESISSVMMNENVSCLLEGIRIYVVEDQKDTLELFTLLLNKLGASEVESFLSAKEAYDSLVNSNPMSVPHVILTDLTMPDEDGYSLYNRIRSREAELELDPIPIVAVTASSDRSRVFSTGFDHYIAKPVNFNELASSIQSLFHQKQQSNNNKSSSSNVKNDSTKDNRRIKKEKII